MNEKKFVEYRPRFVSGFENKTYDVKNIEEVLEIDFVKQFYLGKNFHSYALSIDTKPEYKLTLMALYNWNEEYNGCSEWWVVGYLPGFIAFETGLKSYHDYICGHKPNCWVRKYNGNKDMLGYDRYEESRFKILKELGWEREDKLGIAVHCDCGYNEKFNKR